VLSLEDCVALCGLTEDEVLAIAHHEKLTETAAAALGSYLLGTPQGTSQIKSMIRDDLVEAQACGDAARVLALKLALRHFVLNHPDCDERLRGALRLPDRRRP